MRMALGLRPFCNSPYGVRAEQYDRLQKGIGWDVSIRQKASVPEPNEATQRSCRIPPHAFDIGQLLEVDFMKQEI
jgi:hypothetical protein